MFCGIIDFFSSTTSFHALSSMGKPDSLSLPCASAYLNCGIGLFARNKDIFLTYPMTKSVDGKSYTLILEGMPEDFDADSIILRYSTDGVDFLRTLHGNFSLALFDLCAEALYLMRGIASIPIFFAGDIRFVFATSEEALAAFPERLFGISRLRENSILKYDIQGVRFA